jgi:hypothetical protein
MLRPNGLIAAARNAAMHSIAYASALLFDEAMLAV